jgi:hypothetical protein
LLTFVGDDDERSC